MAQMWESLNIPVERKEEVSLIVKNELPSEEKSEENFDRSSDVAPTIESQNRVMSSPSTDPEENSDKRPSEVVQWLIFSRWIICIPLFWFASMSYKDRDFESEYNDELIYVWIIAVGVMFVASLICVCSFILDFGLRNGDEPKSHSFLLVSFSLLLIALGAGFYSQYAFTVANKHDFEIKQHYVLACQNYFEQRVDEDEYLQNDNESTTEDNPLLIFYKDLANFIDNPMTTTTEEPCYSEKLTKICESYYINYLVYSVYCLFFLIGTIVLDVLSYVLSYAESKGLNAFIESCQQRFNRIFSRKVIKEEKANTFHCSVRYGSIEEPN